jgi:hypothetical protein
MSHKKDHEQKIAGHHTRQEHGGYGGDTDINGAKEGDETGEKEEKGRVQKQRDDVDDGVHLEALQPVI